MSYKAPTPAPVTEAHVPQELFDTILEYYADIYDSEFSTPIFAAPPLLQCTLVSRAWRYATRRAAFRTVSAPANTMPTFIDLLQSPLESFGIHVKNLVIFDRNLDKRSSGVGGQICPSHVRQVLAKLPLLQRLYLDDVCLRWEPPRPGVFEGSETLYSLCKLSLSVRFIKPAVAPGHGDPSDVQGVILAQLLGLFSEVHSLTLRDMESLWHLPMKDDSDGDVDNHVGSESEVQLRVHKLTFRSLRSKDWWNRIRRGLPRRVRIDGVEDLRIKDCDSANAHILLDMFGGTAIRLCMVVADGPVTVAVDLSALSCLQSLQLTLLTHNNTRLSSYNLEKVQFIGRVLGSLPPDHITCLNITTTLHNISSDRDHAVLQTLMRVDTMIAQQKNLQDVLLAIDLLQNSNSEMLEGAEDLFRRCLPRLYERAALYVTT
ncbi:hypothetical protein EUX98_g6352 [Antrodiella citrinella]|uniref:F-box domain-containing protein n=1 Tax=Antrodiella citrinella TaxID=2447956 RepID=A0A4S4MR29_9APHY|nr:hypothetical protein EUX98_g6352 [Antrodiella citrinella]